MLNRKNTAMILAAAMLAGSLAACSFDMDKASKAVNDLGNSIDEAVNGTEAETETTVSETSEVIVETPAEPTPESVAEATPTPTATPTATPTPTSTPTATPTPQPERVDFSELTTDTISEGIDVMTEEFEESFHAEDDTLLCSFTGERLLVTIDDASNVQTAINLMCDSFYQEALGCYNSYSAEAAAEYALLFGVMPETEEDEEEAEAETGTDAEEEENTRTDDAQLTDPYAVEIAYDYSTNGRLLTVMSTYTVTRGEEVLADVSENTTYDLYTGQIVGLNDISDDEQLLRDYLTSCLVGSVPEEDEENPVEFSELFIIAEEPGSRSNIAEVRGIADGEIVSTIIDVDDLAPYLNRFGKLVYFVGQN